MSDHKVDSLVRRTTDDAPHQISEIVQKCKNACESYRQFSEELVCLVAEQDGVFKQHEDLLEEAYVELKAR